jgi:hypothetical protein
MALELLPESKVNGILSNFRTMFKANNVYKMNKSGYGFIYLASGFIAHFNMYGFMEAYGAMSEKEDYLEHGDMTKLALAIIENAEPNKWLNFRSGEKDYDYMMQKARIYKEIYELACKFLESKYKIKIERTDFTQRNPFHYGQKNADVREAVQVALLIQKHKTVTR